VPYQVDSGDGETLVSKNYHKGSKPPALLVPVFPFNGEAIHPTSLLTVRTVIVEELAAGKSCELFLFFALYIENGGTSKASISTHNGS